LDSNNPPDSKGSSLPGSEGAIEDVFNMNNIEASNVTLTVSDGTHTTHVTPTGDHDKVTSIKLDKLGDLASSNVKFDSVVD
jgi:hypothetical protein